LRGGAVLRFPDFTVPDGGSIVLDEQPGTETFHALLTADGAQARRLDALVEELPSACEPGPALPAGRWLPRLRAMLETAGGEVDWRRATLRHAAWH
jgi:hypothetical protein